MVAINFAACMDALQAPEAFSSSHVLDPSSASLPLGALLGAETAACMTWLWLLLLSALHITALQAQAAGNAWPKCFVPLLELALWSHH